VLFLIICATNFLHFFGACSCQTWIVSGLLSLTKAKTKTITNSLLSAIKLK